MARHTIIIAEAGVNHNGDLETAKRLVDVAADAGADYVKFQTFKAERLVTGNAALAGYQKRNIGCGADHQLAMLRKLELDHAAHLALIAHCRDKGIKFLSTAFDLESIALLASLMRQSGNEELWKVPSGEITNYPYLREIAGRGARVLLSTGMSTNADIAAAIDVLTAGGTPLANITLLHCNTQYPTPMADVNLRAMQAMAMRFGTAVGYSDHTLGIEVPVAATALGATVIEKHFTLDRDMAGPDHKASLTPDELRGMVRAIRNIEVALGSSAKHVTDSEKNNINVARKSICARIDIKKGTILTDDNLCAKRPGNGISPMLWPMVVGTAAIRDFNADEPIALDVKL